MEDLEDNTPWVATPWGLEKMNEKCGLCSASCKSTVSLGCCRVDACPICAVKVMTKAMECGGCMEKQTKGQKNKRKASTNLGNVRTKNRNEIKDGGTVNGDIKAQTEGHKNDKEGNKHATVDDRTDTRCVKDETLEMKDTKTDKITNTDINTSTTDEKVPIINNKHVISGDKSAVPDDKNASTDKTLLIDGLLNKTPFINDKNATPDTKTPLPDDKNATSYTKTPLPDDKNGTSDTKTPLADNKNDTSDTKTPLPDDKNATPDTKMPQPDALNAVCSLCGDFCVCGAITSSTTDILKCSVCGDICKRAVVTRCCKASACRACGIKKLTGVRACWVERCGREGVTTKELDNDEVMRLAVEQYKKNGQVGQEQLEELKGRLVREIESMPEIIDVPKPTPILIEIDDTEETTETIKSIPQGGTIKCSQDGKDRIILTETNSYSEWRKIPEQDQLKTHSCWRKTNIKIEGEKKPAQKATPEYRKGPAVEEETIRSIPQGGVIHCKQSGSERIIRTETNTYSGWSKTNDEKEEIGKRKSSEKEPGCKVIHCKRFKSSKRIIYLDIEMIHSHQTKPKIFQIGLSTTTDDPSENKQFFQPILSQTILEIESKGALESLNLSRSDEKMFFNKKSTSEFRVCKEERETFIEMLDFIQSVKDKFSECAVIAYRSDTIRHFIETIQRVGLEKRFRGLVTKVGVLEEMLEEKGMWPWLPLKSLSQAYFVATGQTLSSSVSTSDEVARTLEVIASKLAKRHKIDIIKLTTPLSKLLATNSVPCDKTEKVEVEIPPNTLTTENSCSFIGSINILDRVEEDETDEGVEGKNEIEILTNSVIYPTLNQPIVTVLKNLDKKATLVRLKLSNVITERSAENKWTLFPDPIPVFRIFGKSYAIPRVFTEANNCEVQKIDALDSLDAGTVLGEVTDFETEVRKERRLNRLIDLLYTSNRGADSTISVGPTPLAILVKLKLLSKKSSKNCKINDLFRRSDVFTLEKCNIPDIEIVSSLFSVDPNVNYNWRARIVIKSKTNLVKSISEGDLIGRACLVDDDEDILKAISLAKKQPKILPKPKPRKTPPKEKCSEPLNDRKSCVTLSKVRLYAQCPNCILLKLSGNSFKTRFSSVTLEYSKEFRNLVRDKNRQDKTGFGLKSSLSQFQSPVSWCQERPYAFINVNFFGGKQTQETAFIDLEDNFEVATYKPNDDIIAMETDNKLSMNVCVDFSVRNIIVDSKPTPIEVYLRFNDTVTIDKKQVLVETFSLSKICSEKLDVLTCVFIPKPNKSLAPQRTSTNDMRATLIVKSKDDAEVTINAREVIAEATVTNPENYMLSNKIAIEPAPVPTPEPVQAPPEVEMEDVPPTPPEISNPATEANNVRYPGVRIQNFVVPPLVTHNPHNLHNLVNPGLRLGVPMYRFGHVLAPGAHLLNPQVVPTMHGAPLFLPTAGLARMAGPRLFFRF